MQRARTKERPRVQTDTHMQNLVRAFSPQLETIPTCIRHVSNDGTHQSELLRLISTHQSELPPSRRRGRNVLDGWKAAKVSDPANSRCVFLLHPCGNTISTCVAVHLPPLIPTMSSSRLMPCVSCSVAVPPRSACARIRARAFHLRSTTLKQHCTTEDIHRWRPGQRCQWNLDRTPAQRRTGRASRLLQTQPARDMVAAVSWRGARASAPFLRSWQHAHLASYACAHTERSADAAVEFIAIRAGSRGRTEVQQLASGRH